MSLRRILIPILAAVLPAFGLAIGLVVQGASDHREQVLERHELRAITTSFALDQVVKNQAGEAELVAASPLVTRRGSSEALREYLRELLDINPSWDEIAIVGGAGRPIAGTRRADPDEDFRGRPYFEQAVREDEVAVSGPMADPLGGGASIRVAAPIAFDAGGRGALVVTLPLEWIHDAVAEHVPPRARMKLVDREEALLVEPGWRGAPRPPPEGRWGARAALFGDAGAEVTSDEDGEGIVAARAPIPDRGWAVVLTTPTDHAFRHADERLRNGLGLSALALGAIGLLSWRLGGRLVETMRRTDEARDRAETAQRRAALAAEASRRLTARDSYEDTIAEVASLAGGELAARCAVEFTSEAGAVRAIPIDGAGARPAGAAEALKAHRASLQRGRARAVVLHDPPSHALIAPMGRSERLFGWMIFWREIERPFDADERALAEDLGRRAGMAIANAELYRRARESTLAREQMLSVVAHDLRSPLSAIDLTAATLVRTDDVPESARHKLERIHRSSLRMQGLIRDLLDAAPGDPAALCADAGAHAAGALIRETAWAYEPLAAEKEVRLTAEASGDEVIVLCDRARIEQVLSNLATNAIRFTPPGGAVALRARRAEEGGLFEVRDTGPGIALTDLPHIFERFWRGASGGGTGLGLAIAKAIVEAHEGRIWVENRPEGGASFFFVIPSPADEGAEGGGTDSRAGA